MTKALAAALTVVCAVSSGDAISDDWTCVQLVEHTRLIPFPEPWKNAPIASQDIAEGIPCHLLDLLPGIIEPTIGAWAYDPGFKKCFYWTRAYMQVSHEQKRKAWASFAKNAAFPRVGNTWQRIPLDGLRCIVKNKAYCPPLPGISD